MIKINFGYFPRTQAFFQALIANFRTKAFYPTLQKSFVKSILAFKPYTYRRSHSGSDPLYMRHHHPPKS